AAACVCSGGSQNVGGGGAARTSRNPEPRGARTAEKVQWPACRPSGSIRPYSAGGSLSPALLLRSTEHGEGTTHAPAAPHGARAARHDSSRRPDTRLAQPRTPV